MFIKCLWLEKDFLSLKMKEQITMQQINRFSYIKITKMKPYVPESPEHKPNKQSTN